jgi:AcrR family transcriptional regulator
MALLKLKQKRSLQRRRAIMDAAIKVFGDKGVHGTTLTNISDVAGVPLSSVYDYFENKAQLLTALPRATFEAFYAHVDTLIARSCDPHRKLRVFYMETLRYIERNPAWARLFFLEIWPSVLVEEAEVRLAIDGFGRRIIDIIKQGIADGRLAATNDPHLLMGIILGSMTHIVAVWLLYEQPFDLTTQANRTLALLLPILRPAARGNNKKRRKDADRRT